MVRTSWIVPFSPGGPSDIIGRFFAAKLTDALGRQVVVDNRGGATGIIAFEIAARAVPDGYTVLQAGASGLTTNPHLHAKLPYDVERDFRLVTQLVATPNMLVVHASLPARSVKELIALAKAKPGQMNYGSSGTGGLSHLSGALFSSLAQIDIVHVPYKGGAPAAAAVAAGDVHFGVMAAPGAIPHIKSGRGKVIGIPTAKKSPLDPSWATPRDAGIPDLDASIWVGLFAPKGTPQPIVDRLNKEVRETLKVPDVQKRFIESAGGEAVGMSEQEFLARIKADAERYKRVVQKAGVKPG